MLSIPKLAKGGIITPTSIYPIGDDRRTMPCCSKLKDKYYAIYKRTKKARIKKKAAKKSWILALRKVVLNNALY
ncbi:MAG: hypothetical protein IJ031_05900 [Oscillospiraceae bacterium]|nr:hypothetical protein [Oscillospiraceae bacterium]MBQ8377586.1 hypothetical protein [Oscillospiraceae bacterium]MBQ8884107.1 hypothetical protein [Oscillospiraceae bacterium]